MDELSQAFEGPAARAAATAGGDPCDRISVRDYLREVEIGAFRAERGTTQRIRFNIVLEVSAHVAARDDDVDKVLSYDTITQAIEAELAAARVNLLETLAERIAARVLRDRRALRIFVRIEKLDRIPGALGVEIVRSRRPEAPAIVPVAPEAPVVASAGPDILFLDDAAEAGRWAAGLSGRRAALLLPPLPGFRAGIGGAAGRQMTLLSMDQNAVRLAALHPGCAVVDSLTELDWALEEGHLPLIAPARIVAASAMPPDWEAAHPAALALWFGQRLASQRVIAAGAPQPGISRHCPHREDYGAPDL
ncbi:MAG: dihydroneopterin aldolase [Pseudomonadota bacterium]